ncbi:hypothetical protein V1279_001933 [Bradyrhizobium sp. AZCC 1610]
MDHYSYPDNLKRTSRFFIGFRFAFTSLVCLFPLQANVGVVHVLYEIKVTASVPFTDQVVWGSTVIENG